MTHGWHKQIARALLGDYAIYQVWRFETTDAPVIAAPFDVRSLRPEDLGQPCVAAELADSAWYLGDQAEGFGCFQGDTLLGAAFYWHGRRYATRRSWPVPPRAAKLVHLITASTARGQGVATAVIRASAAQMQARGWRPLYARVWPSNASSLSAFRRAGWQPCGWLLQINPLRRSKHWNLRLSLPTSKLSIR